ncbi:class I SAM-dependent methyltransferase [Fodinibius sp.]|uniref:class I SAM-dependent methyltransferase n=1 Tax=Fodinibius sp. TaxID=1872440 RepID=UPI002ACD4E98|nr:class I SAM-dependent methyltransferase [Fodinibius sp.]MDZ7658883.1 class I SAM-dependent methyltransferase [Fodinibius sp.]
MPLFLSHRDTESKERMDDPHCDADKLYNTYQQFSQINALISRWRHIYKQFIRPHLNQHSQFSFLDIGFGGGDIPIKLAAWLQEDGINFKITAIDPDPRAMEFAQTLDMSSNIEFLQCELSELNPETQQFDFVLSNHLVHHLDEQELISILQQAKKLCSKSVLFNDLRRNDWAYLLFNIFSRPFFRNSFITEDGLISIKRSYTKNELAAIIPQDWNVQNLFPFRLMITCEDE